MVETSSVHHHSWSAWNIPDAMLIANLKQY